MNEQKAAAFPITIFYSYAHEDERLRKGLEKHLGVLRQQGIITEWYDRRIVAGTDWKQAIDHHLMTASVILLLISPDFMASDYCYGIEMQRALERHDAHEACVIPVILRPVDWQGAPFARLQCLPRDAKPVTTWSNRDKAFLDIARGIRAAIEQLQAPSGRFQPPSSLLRTAGSQESLPSAAPERFSANTLNHPTAPLAPHAHKHLFMAEEMPGDFVPRPYEFEALKRCVLNEQRERPIAITAALRGAGGYGKTTLAQALCHDKEIQAAFLDGILWVTLGETPGNLVGKVEDIIYLLHRERISFTSLEAASTLLKELLEDRSFLLVLDDVWHASDLKPFLQGGPRCARLITTRDDTVLPANAQHIQVDAMRQEEALQLLSSGLDKRSISAHDLKELGALAGRLGEWALLLKLVNNALRERVSRYQQPLHDALVHLNKALDKYGLTLFDARNTQHRSQAVAATLRVSLEQLTQDEQARYHELAIFPQDANIPLEIVQKLWGKTGQVDDLDTESLCERLHKLSLLLHFDPTARTIRLHDVVHAYLEHEIRTALVSLHGQLLDAYSLTYWADLPHDDSYMWEYLAYHLIAAGQGETLVVTVKDLRYLATKAYVRRSTYTVEADLGWAMELAPSDASLPLLKRHVANMSHLLQRCETLQDVGVALHSRLNHEDSLGEICRALENTLSRPFLTSWHALPDLPHPALVRTLYGHAGFVYSCAISAAGDVIVSASEDRTLKVWDGHTGQERLTLRGHTEPVYSCAISAAGDVVVSASEDQTLKVWDGHTGQERLTLRGHSGPVMGCAISAAGDVIVSASEDQMLKVWDAHTGQARLTLGRHQERWVRHQERWGVANYKRNEHWWLYKPCCAMSAEGDLLVFELRWVGELKV